MGSAALITVHDKSDDQRLTEIKRNLFLFDEVGITSYLPMKKLSDDKLFVGQLQHLKESGLIFSTTERVEELVSDEKLLYLWYNENTWEVVPNDAPKSETKEESVNLHSRGWASLINKFNLVTDVTAYAVMKNDWLIKERTKMYRQVPGWRRGTPDEPKSSPNYETYALTTGETVNSDVVKIVIDKMPIPDLSTPLEDILEFKNNPDNQGRFTGLKNWMNKAIRSGLPINELNDELEHLLYQYRTSLKIHNIKNSSSVLESVLVIPAEIVEKTVWGKFGEAMKVLFSAKHAKADLLKEEMTAPGNEVAYIYEAQKRFG